jgi:hypothetical protein
MEGGKEDKLRVTEELELCPRQVQTGRPEGEDGGKGEEERKMGKWKSDWGR